MNGRVRGLHYQALIEEGSLLQGDQPGFRPVGLLGRERRSPRNRRREPTDSRPDLIGFSGRTASAAPFPPRFRSSTVRSGAIAKPLAHALDSVRSHAASRSGCRRRRRTTRSRHWSHSRRALGRRSARSQVSWHDPALSRRRRSRSCGVPPFSTKLSERDGESERFPLSEANDGPTGERRGERRCGG
jgi:hypothetical protein